MRYLIPLLLLATPLLADPPTVESVEAQRNGDSWTFAVTLSHPDTGWEHYADGWRVELENGVVLATRVLAHPHETEQPFTRTQSGIAIPEGTARVVIRASCLIEGWSEQGTVFELP